MDLHEINIGSIFCVCEDYSISRLIFYVVLRSCYCNFQLHIKYKIILLKMKYHIMKRGLTFSVINVHTSFNIYYLNGYHCEIKLHIILGVLKKIMLKTFVGTSLEFHIFVQLGSVREPNK